MAVNQKAPDDNFSILPWWVAILSIAKRCGDRGRCRDQHNSTQGVVAARTMISAVLSGLLAGIATVPCWAKAYGNHDVRRLLVPASTPGADGSPNLAYLDRMLLDLSEHAANYPPQFDSSSDMQRAKRDTRNLIGMFNAAIGAAPSTALRLRMALLGSYGRNLNVVEGAGLFAQTHFRKLLSTDANDAMSNYHYGAFLAGIGRLKESLPFLKKAVDKGVTPALYEIGIAQLGLGDKVAATVAFNEHLKRNPLEQKVRILVDASRDGKVVVQVEVKR